MSESLRLVGNAARDLLDVAGDVGEFDPKATDAVGKLVDQPFSLARIGGSFHARKLHNRHFGVSPGRIDDCVITTAFPFPVRSELQSR